MNPSSFRFLSGVAIVVSGLATGVPGPTARRVQAQEPERLPRFEVASVKENVSGESRTRMQTSPGGRFVVTNAPLRGLIAEAFAMADSSSLVRSRVLGGPEWINSARYDINAKANTDFEFIPGGPPTDLGLRIRSLLEERFKLVAHRETRELPIYELVVARVDGKLGPGLHESDADCEAAIAARRAGVVTVPSQPNAGPPCGLMGGPARTIAGGATMQQVAANLTVRLERLVIDKTGLQGRFAFNLAWTPERMPTEAPPPGIPPIDPNGPSIFTALQAQLGLKLQSAKGQLDVLVIENVERPAAD